MEFDEFGIDFTAINIVCWGTGYQIMAVIPDKTAISARDAFAREWIKHYSWPELLVTDQGPEFTANEFTRYVASGATLHHFIDSQSPWQQGRTERAGGAVKDMLKDVVAETGIVTMSDLELALSHAVDSRNRYCNLSLIHI